MRINILTSFLAIILLHLLIPVFSQEVSSYDARKFNLAILGVLDEYERTSSFSEPRDRQSFVKLFSNPDDMCVYNDIMGSGNFQEMITPSTYVNNVPDDGKLLIKTVISDVKKDGDITVNGGLLHRVISFSKYMMIIDASVYTKGEGGVLFDSSQNFGKEPDFRISMDLAFDPETGKCSIAKISPKEPKKPSPLDEDRFSVIIKSSEKYDKRLRSKGNPITFNDFNQAIAYYNDIEVDNPDVYTQSVEQASGDRYNVLGLKFKPMYFRAKFYGGTSLGKAFSLLTSHPGITSSTKSLQLGVDLGFEVSMSTSWRLGLYAGIGYSSSKIGLSVFDVDYTLSYMNPSRHYRFSATEDLSLSDFVVPVYLENEFTLARRLVLDLDLGTRIYLNHGTELSPMHVTGEIGNQSVTADFSAFKDPATYSRSPYDIALYANAEIDYRILSRFLYAYVSYWYERGLSPVYDTGLQPFYNSSQSVYPFYYSPMLERDIPNKSLISSVSYTRNAGMISFGLKLKF